MQPITPQNETSRRSFLRGLGASIALPAFASLGTSSALANLRTNPTLAQTATGAPLRTAFLYFPNGVIQDAWWPKETGSEFQLSRTLAPLANVRDKIQVLGGLDQVNAEAGNDGAGDHARGGGVFLTGVRIKKSASDIRSGVSFDQAMAQEIGHLTRFSSLELSCEPTRTTGNCDSGYSCAYSFNLSWSSPTTPKTPESNPRLLFERMFGTGKPHERMENLQQRREQQRSILDFAREDARKIRKQLGTHDRRKLDQYLTGVRELESRIEKSERLTDPGSQLEQPPAGIPKEYPEYVETMFDMLLLAFQTDSTRIATFMLSHDGSNRSFQHIGIPEGHHNLSHHRNDEELMQKIAEIDLWYIQQLSVFLARLAEVEDVDGMSLLDNSMIVYGSGNSDGNRHTHRNLPILLAGGGGGSLTQGRYVDHKSQPMCNLYLALAEKMGVGNFARFGDSTGVLTNI